MQVRSWLVRVSLLMSLVGCATALAGDEAPARQFASGKALLAKADFAGALSAFKAATKAEPENDEYFQELALLRRILNMRDQLPEEKDNELWQKMALGLWNYYDQNGIHGEALAIARTMHEKLGTSESAAVLAETQIGMGKDAEAATVLDGLAKDARTPHTNVLHGIALAHLGKPAEAKGCAERLEIPKDCDAKICYDAARLYALTGHSAKALESLKCALEMTPAHLLATARNDAKVCADFSKLAPDEAFGTVLATESKVKAGCGSAAGCGKCPLKGKDKGCGEDKGKAKEGEHQPGCAPGK